MIYLVTMKDPERNYIYLGDSHSDPTLKGACCAAVLNEAGKCIRGRNGSMLGRFETGRTAVVIGRLLRKTKPAHD